MITKEQWVDWKRNPVTQQYLRDLLETREGLKEGLAEGQSSNEREDCRTVGQCQGIKDSVEYAIQSFKYMEIDNGTQSGVVSSNSEG